MQERFNQRKTSENRRYYLTTMSNELLFQARKRILATLSLYRKHCIDFLGDLDATKYEFIDKKYGGTKYESYRDNQLYGNGSIYRYSKGLRPDTRLHIVIPHGFTPGEVIWSKEISAQLPIACFSDHVKFKYSRVAQKYNIKTKLFSSVHPFQSLLHKIDKLKASSNDDIRPTQEAVYFPLHSTKAIASNIHASMENAKSKLDLIRKKYASLSLCIYYIDYINLVKSGEWEGYRSKFNKVYCCGSRYEPAFLVNLALILKEHKILVTEGVGSHIFFGAMANTKIDLLKYSESLDCYKFKDSAQKSRNDHKARKHNIQALAELHYILDGCSKDKNLMINRYINYYLSEEEKKIECEYIQATQDVTCQAFSGKFDSKMYPLIE